MATETHVQKYPVGIVGVSLGEIERQVPSDEAPPLPPNDKLQFIGKPVLRINGRAKVTGRATYTVDVRLPGMLHARLLRSPHPHARILSINTKAAERLSGVRAVHVLEHVIGRAVEISNGPDRRVLYVGDPVAAVAAVTPQKAEAALHLINVDYQQLLFVIDIEDARKPDAPLVFMGPVEGTGFGDVRSLPQHGNVRGPNRGASRGDARRGWRPPK